MNRNGTKCCSPTLSSSHTHSRVQLSSLGRHIPEGEFAYLTLPPFVPTRKASLAFVDVTLPELAEDFALVSFRLSPTFGSAKPHLEHPSPTQKLPLFPDNCCLYIPDSMGSSVSESPVGRDKQEDSSNMDKAWAFLKDNLDVDEAAVAAVNMNALRRQIDWRIVPLMFLCYTMQFLDKVILNVGFPSIAYCVLPTWWKEY